MRKVLTSLFNQSRRACLLNIQSQQCNLTPLFAKNTKVTPLTKVSPNKQIITVARNKCLN